MARSVSRKLRDTCALYGAFYRDLTELASFHGDPERFVDGNHLMGDNLRRLINVLFDLDSEAVVAKWPSDAEIIEKLPSVNTLDTR